MPTDEGEQPCGICVFWEQTGDVVRDLDAGLAGGDAFADRDAMTFEATDLVNMRPRRAVRAGATQPAEDARVADGPEYPEFTPPMADFRLRFGDAGDLASLVSQPAWGDRYAVAVLGRCQPRGKMPPRPRPAGLAGWHPLTGRRPPPA